MTLDEHLLQDLAERRGMSARELGGLIEALDLELAVRDGSADPRFDREGRVITFGEWVVLADDPVYRKVRRTEFEGGWASTRWMGVGIGATGRRVLFETLVFTTSGNCIHHERHETEAIALARHDALVNQWAFDLLTERLR